jgi:hypothetical protein
MQSSRNFEPTQRFKVRFPMRNSELWGYFLADDP